MMVKILLVVASVARLGCVFGCQSDEDCELNGLCEDRVCRCFNGWKGSTCGTLDLLPAKTPYGTWPTEKEQSGIVPNSSAYSWGFSYLFSDGKHHGFANVGCYICKVGQVVGSFLAHVQSDNIEGPYSYVDTAIPQNAFNPHVYRLERGYAMVYRSNHYDNKYSVCTGDHDTPVGPPSTNTSEIKKAKAMNLAFSNSLNGPWSIQPMVIKGWESIHVSNPSLLFLENGTVLLAYRYNIGGEHIGFAKGPSVHGPFTHYANLSIPGEDPFIWMSKRGTFHMLFHVEDSRAYSSAPGLHAFSKDGLSWKVSNATQGAYSTTIHFRDGTQKRYYRRERPELVFNAHGDPVHFFSAAQDNEKLFGCSFGYARSIVQPISSGILIEMHRDIPISNSTFGVSSIQ
uniref:EGF-like domain-containing protein n=1 Tax=Mucochytrium quahogii TaxID=96639 RepID=A0A7S2WTF9_9STRA|mmetsp:Transcript_12199/g.19833  ORF Transcript_12199/g.19833 Transcript_12199/m.19833 type:complete len:399 (-) Transcript_12199:177-1373(-)